MVANTKHNDSNTACRKHYLDIYLLDFIYLSMDIHLIKIFWQCDSNLYCLYFYSEPGLSPASLHGLWIPFYSQRILQMRAWQGPPPSLPLSWSFSKIIVSIHCPVSVIRLSTQYNFVHTMSELVPVGGDQIHPAALAVQDHCVHTHPNLRLQLGQNIYVSQFSSLVSTLLWYRHTWCQEKCFIGTMWPFFSAPLNSI